MEFTLKIKLGKDGAEDYSALDAALLSIHDAIGNLYKDCYKYQLPIPPFKQTTKSVLKLSLNEPTAIGEWKIAPAEEKMSARLLARFPWLENKDEDEILGSEVIPALDSFYEALKAEGL